MASPGAVEVKVTVCDPWPTEKLCWIWGAAAQVVLSPPWLASMMQTPTPLKLTFPLPSIEQTELARVSMVRVTDSPERTLAVGAYVDPPTTASAGAAVEKVMVWGSPATTKDCETVGAASQSLLPP